MDRSAFEQLKIGNEAALEQAYVAYYGYVTGMLIYRKRCPKADAQDIYADAILRFRRRAVEGAIHYDNIKSYILITAINLWKDWRKGKASELERAKHYIAEMDRTTDKSYDFLEAAEDQQALDNEKNKKIQALQQAINTIGEPCKSLLIDNIVKNLKPRHLAEKYDYKNARVITTKLGRCKNQLKTLATRQLT